MAETTSIDIVKANVKAEAVRIAKEQSKLKVREEGAENRGPIVDIYLERAHIVDARYLKNKAKEGYQWCGMFVYYCYSEAAKKYASELPFGHSDLWSAYRLRVWAEEKEKELVRKIIETSIVTNKLIIWDKRQKKDSKDVTIKAGDIFTIEESHVGLVSADAENDIFESIEGNQSDTLNKWNGIENRTAKRRRHINDCSMIVRI